MFVAIVVSKVSVKVDYSVESWDVGMVDSMDEGKVDPMDARVAAG